MQLPHYKASPKLERRGPPNPDSTNPDSRRSSLQAQTLYEAASELSAVRIVLVALFGGCFVVMAGCKPMPLATAHTVAPTVELREAPLLKFPGASPGPNQPP